MQLPWNAYIKAEAIKARRTSLVYLPFVGLFLALMNITLSQLASGQGFQSTPFAWQSLYITGISAPILALIATLPERREVLAQEGGIPTHAVSMQRLRLARFLLVCISSLALQLLLFVPMIPVGAPPIAAFLAILFAWIGSLGPLGLFSALGRVIGLIPTLLIAVLWQIVGVISTEKEFWYFSPPAWALRIMLRPMNIHINAVPLEPDSPLRTESPTLGLMLCLLLAVLAGVLTYSVSPASPTAEKHRCFFTQHRQHRDRTRTTTDKDHTAFDLAHIAQGTGRKPVGYLRTIGAFARSLHRTGVYPLSILTVMLITLTAFIYSETTALQLYSYFLVPLGTGFLSVLSWYATRPVYSQNALDNPRAHTGFTLTHTAIVSVITLVVAAITRAPFPSIVLLLLIGSALATGCCAAVMRFGNAAPIVLSLIVCVFSITIGGDVLAHTKLWVIGIAGWPLLASADPMRFTTAFILSVLLCGCSWWAFHSASKKHHI